MISSKPPESRIDGDNPLGPPSYLLRLPIEIRLRIPAYVFGILTFNRIKVFIDADRGAPSAVDCHVLKRPEFHPSIAILRSSE